MKTILTVIFVMFFTTGCYQKYLLLQAEAVSMTQTNAGSTKELKPVGPVSEKFCLREDKPHRENPERVYGLADEVIMKAQKGGTAGDFITNVKIYYDTNACAMLEGNLAKM